MQKSLGSYNRIISEAEKEKILKFRRSIVAVKNLKKDKTISIDDLDAKRPGTGIAPNHVAFVIGRKLSRDVQEDDLLSWEDLI